MEVARRRSHSFNNFTLRLRTVSGIERPRVSNRPQKIHPPTSIYIYIYILWHFCHFFHFRSFCIKSFLRKIEAKEAFPWFFSQLTLFGRRSSPLLLLITVDCSQTSSLSSLTLERVSLTAHPLSSCPLSLPLAALPAEMMTFRPTLSPRGVCIRIEMRGQAAFSEGV